MNFYKFLTENMFFIFIFFMFAIFAFLLYKTSEQKSEDKQRYFDCVKDSMIVDKTVCDKLYPDVLK